MVFSRRAILFQVLIATAYAANDWGKPCFDGECSYDLPKAKSSEPAAAGTVRIWGSAGAIGDITTAGGWEIIGCSPHSLSQNVRIVCKSEDAESACNHLYQNGGAVNKIVRLPESCGSNAFARIARESVAKDQTLPADIAAKIVRRGGVTPEVKEITIDTNFSAIDPAKTGPVYMTVHGMNAPGYQKYLDTTPGPVINPGISKRGFWDWVEDIVDTFLDFDLEESTTLPPIDIDKTYNLFTKSITCGPVSASVRADINGKVHAVIDIGVVAAGTIIPPDLEQFYIYAGLNADLAGKLSLDATAMGEVSTGEVTIYEVGIPGLDFPGILQIGPAFKINAMARAALDVKLDMDVGLNYQIRNAKLVFPPSASAPSSGSFSPADTPLQLSASAGVVANGIVEGHIIPRLDVGLDALGVVKAHVFLNLDGTAALDLSLQAGVSTGSKVEAKPHALPRRHLAELEARDEPVSTEVAASFNGCVGLNAGLSINAGADASFFGLFDKNTAVQLFHRDFQLYNKCWSAGSSVKRDLLLPRALICAAPQIGSPVQMTNGNIKAADIRAI